MAVKIMTKLQILSGQIQTNTTDLIKGLEQGTINTEEIMEALIVINNKVKDWGKEASKIMDEAKATDSKAEERD